MPDQKTETPQDFESAFHALQDVIARLEANELPLEDALRLYEEGKRLSALCTDLLEKATLRVSMLNEAPPPAAEEAEGE